MGTADFKQRSMIFDSFFIIMVKHIVLDMFYGIWSIFIHLSYNMYKDDEPHKTYIFKDKISLLNYGY